MRQTETGGRWYKEAEWLGRGVQSLLASLQAIIFFVCHWLAIPHLLENPSEEEIMTVTATVPHPDPLFPRAEEEDEGIVEDSDYSPQTDCRRDSDVGSSGDSGSEDDLADRILVQVEGMFSDEHLAKDGFLLKHVRRRSDGFVSLKLVAGLRKVKQLSREFNTVLGALQASQVLEVNPEGTKVRRKEALSSDLKALPLKQAKKSHEKENSDPPSTEEMSKSGPTNTMRKNSTAGNNALNSRRNSQSGPAQRKVSAGSVCSSSGLSSGYSSRHSSICGGRPHPADLFRNLMTSSLLSGEESPRRRGGSLPQKGSPPGSGFLRPKSNSYCEGTVSSTGMSPWLLRRKASVASTRLSTGEIQISGVVRQPRGPDGTKGFQSGYRALILQQRLSPSTSQAC